MTRFSKTSHACLCRTRIARDVIESLVQPAFQITGSTEFLRLIIVRPWIGIPLPGLWAQLTTHRRGFPGESRFTCLDPVHNFGLKLRDPLLTIRQTTGRLCQESGGHPAVLLISFRMNQENPGRIQPVLTTIPSHHLQPELPGLSGPDGLPGNQALSSMDAGSIQPQGLKSQGRSIHGDHSNSPRGVEDHISLAESRHQGDHQGLKCRIERYGRDRVHVDHFLTDDTLRPVRCRPPWAP